MVPFRRLTLLALVIALLFLALMRAPDITASVQTGFLLDLDNPGFSYQELRFNDSNSSKVHDFSGGGDSFTIGVSVSRNSTVSLFELNLTGKIQYIYQESVNSPGLLDASIGNITTDPGNEIIIGSSKGSGASNIYALSGQDAGLLWTYNLTSQNNDIFSTDTGNVTSFPGKEVVFGAENNRVYVLEVTDSGATEAWNYLTSDDVNAVRVANLTGNGDNYVVAGADKAYILNSSGELVCNSSLMTVNGLDAGNLTSDPGQEIAVASGSFIRIINSSCSTVLSKNVGAGGVSSIAVGNVTDSPYDEVAFGGADYRVYLLNSSLSQVWEYTTQDDVRSVTVGDVVGQTSGNEVVAGSNDRKVYTLSGSGSMIWDYLAESYIETVAVGNLTSDIGNEVVAGAGDGNLYAFNFDYFPTSIQIDVGANGTVDWQYAGTLRNNTETTGLESAVEYYLGYTCSQDLCDVPVRINSSRSGKLNVTDVVAEYSYNASSIINYTTIPGEWSRTSGIQVNESVGNTSKNVSFTDNPGQDILVAYIKIPGGEAMCDFNGTSRSTLTVGADNACSIPNFTVSSSGGLPSSFLFWDSSMSSGVPVRGSGGAFWYTNATDDFTARRNITLSNQTGETFYDIYANTTTDDGSVRGEYFLNVTWKGQPCNITPPSESAACDSGSPAYSSISCSGDTFDVCMKGSFFRWVQPYSNSTVNYTAGGSTNLRPIAESPNTTLNSSYWGDQFNYSIQINDTEGDDVNVTLYYWLESSNTWYDGGTFSLSGNDTAWFNITSSQGWIGENKYMFSYQDFNSSGYPYHSVTNTTELSGPLVRKRFTSVAYVSGNESSVNRTDSTELIVRIADSDEGGFIDAGASCRLWVAYNGTNYDSGMSNVSDSSGYCRFWFTPDGNYSAGNQLWKAGIRGDANYNNSESTEYLVINILGTVNISITRPYGIRKITRNESNHLEGRLVDEYGSFANQSGFNCSFWFDSAYLGSNDTGGDGKCHYYWTPACGYSLGSHYMNITISNETGPYSINNPEASQSVYVYDRLNISVTGPQEYSVSNIGESVDLNSSVNDTCELAGPADHTVSWYLKRKRTLDLIVRKEGGYEGQAFPVIINSSYFEDRDIDLWDWPMNSTRVYLDGEEVPSRINAWNNTQKTELNSSQGFFGEYSELVFIANQSDWQNISYTITYNQSTVPGSFSFIENGGFESGSTGAWNCFGSNSSTGAWSREVCDGSYCACEVRELGGNMSLYLSSDYNGGSDSVQGARYYAGRPLGYDRIRIAYNATGEFDNSTGDAYLRVSAGNGTCDLDFSQKGMRREAVCYNESFGNATWVNITVHDYGFGGGGLIDSSHVHVDYICLAGADGECVNFHSGHRHELVSTSQDLLGTGEDSVWNIPVGESLGIRKLIANVSGTYYVPDRESHYMYVYGWSEIDLGNLSSTNCTFNESWECMKNASLDIFCYVFDANTSRHVTGHNVTFWGAGDYLGSNTTDTGGRALFHWENSSDVMGNHTIVCNITHDSGVFYNATSNNSAETFFLVRSGNTTAGLDINLVPPDPAENLSRELNRTYTLYINLTNTGDTESMYNIQVAVNTQEGVTAGSVACGAGSLLPRTGCNMTSSLNVSYLATEGLKDVFVNVTWHNADISQDNVSAAAGITVVNSTILRITEDYLNYTIPRGGSFQAGTFIIQSYGNTDLSGIELNLSGGDEGNISQWVSFSPSSVAGIAHKGQQAVDVFLSVPNNVSERTYVTNITANATGSLCSPSGLCSDEIEFRVNVTVHDWSVSDTYVNKTIGLMPFNGTIGSITVTNNKEDDWTFNATVFSLNGSDYISAGASEFSVPVGGYYTLRIYHNTSSQYTQGFYTSNIVITNKETAVPYSRNITVDLEVINLSIWIVSPNQTSPTTPLYSGDTLNITANATLTGDPDILEGNMTWSARVGGEDCAGLQSSYSNSSRLWSINCTAPSIPGNPIYNELELTGFYAPESAVLTVREPDAVRYVDVAPPSIERIWVSGADSEGNVEHGTKSEIVVRANISDNIMVQGASADVHYNGQNQSTTQMYNISPYIWTFNFSSPMDEGDYQIIINATDIAGNSNSTNGTLMGYFDIYYPINLNGSLSDKDGDPISATISLFKNGTSWRIHQFSTNSTGHYKWVVHRRVYDMKMEFSGQEITFYSVDMNATAVSQWGTQSPGNVSDPVSLDYFTINSSDITNVVLPNGAANKLMAVAVEKNLSRLNNNILFTLDYGEALSEMTPGERSELTENNFGVYRCPDWDMGSRTCNGGDFQNDSISATVNASADTISFTASETSAYVVAEWEGVTQNNGGDDDDDNQDPGGGSSGSSGSSGTSTVTPSTTLPFDITTSIGNIHIHPGENKSYVFSVRNKMSSNITAEVDVQGLDLYIIPEMETLNIGYNETVTMDMLVAVPEDLGTGTYTGSIIVSSGSSSQEIPVSMTVSIVATELLSLGINILTPNINPGGKLRFAVDVRNLGLPPGFNVTMEYFVKESERELIIEQDSETIYLEDSKVFTKSLDMDEPGLEVGQYYLEIWAYFADGRSVNEVAVFNLAEPYWSSWEGRLILLGIAMVGMSIVGYYLFKRYRLWKREKSRYIFPLDYKKLPQESSDSFWLGKIAETDNKAWFNPPDLTTHLLVAGSTGAGKSVSASVFVEEALEKKIPVVAFDPTAQWTGFVKALEDDNLVKYFPDFRMDPKSVKPYKGMIFEVTDPQELQFALKEGFDRYLNPGEITVFTLDKLKPGQYDEAVSIIIEAMFGRQWEESTTLKVMVVFDEVHRLLEKYGGKGGYVALEKAAREFRKWGIGMIMCSQVLADFKEAIAGNVLTEIQLNTKSMTDIQKVATKYGEEYSKKISRQGVGVGMLQNPKYNDGKPYFVHFRPTYHNPHKISAEDMELYKKFAKRLEKVEAAIAQMKKSGRDTFDIELELRLAKDKLKQGRFRMAQIYISSLEQNLNIKSGD